uniref:Homeobox protein homothorax n=1 Tax=Lygus hesperus TaxID=30085 RepID=A0A0A9VVT7_LYGHE
MHHPPPYQTECVPHYSPSSSNHDEYCSTSILEKSFVLKLYTHLFCQCHPALEQRMKIFFTLTSLLSSKLHTHANTAVHPADFRVLSSNTMLQQQFLNRLCCISPVDMHSQRLPEHLPQQLSNYDLQFQQTTFDTAEMPQYVVAPSPQTVTAPLHTDDFCSINHRIPCCTSIPSPAPPTPTLTSTGAYTADIPSPLMQPSPTACLYSVNDIQPTPQYMSPYCVSVDSSRRMYSNSSFHTLITPETNTHTTYPDPNHHIYGRQKYPQNSLKKFNNKRKNSIFSTTATAHTQLDASYHGDTSSPNGSDSDSNTSPTKHIRRRSKLPLKAILGLRRYFKQSLTMPYPDAKQKLEIATKLNLTFRQVHNWFSNTRKRIYVPWLKRLGIVLLPFKALSPHDTKVMLSIIETVDEEEYMGPL